MIRRSHEHPFPADGPVQRASGHPPGSRMCRLHEFDRGKFKQKRLAGEIDIPVVRLGANSQKAGLGIHLKDLSDYIDRQREKAAKEQNQLMGRARY